MKVRELLNNAKASASPVVTSPTIYDVLVVGGGIVGCAVARKLSLDGAKVILVEKAEDILAGASKGNSAILHTGFDAPPKSIEQTCIAAGYREFKEIHQRFNLPLLKTGALVLAWNDEQATKIDDMVTKAHVNGVTDVVAIDVEAARARVPALGPGVMAAVSIPGECLVDPWSTPLAYLLQALAHGAKVLTHCEVHAGCFEGNHWQLSTTQGALSARWVVNCAGLYGDILHRRLIGEPLFHIQPRKGQFLVYRQPANELTDTILLPVPTEQSKGILVCPTVFGTLLVGPSSQNQNQRDDASVDAVTLKRLQSIGESILPGLKEHTVTAVYAGIRPATASRDYQVVTHREQHYLCLGGIRSTGLSAALGIAQLASQTIGTDPVGISPPAHVQWPTVPQISEAGVRDWMLPGNGGITCHCERVTRREIDNALQGPLPAKSLGGLKRRTRVTMGPCQGFYCSAELSEITAGHFNLPIDVPNRQPTV